MYSAVLLHILIYPPEMQNADGDWLIALSGKRAELKVLFKKVFIKWHSVHDSDSIIPCTNLSSGEIRYWLIDCLATSGSKEGVET